MFRHVVMFRWTEGLEPGHGAAVAAALDRLPDLIPEIRGYRHGPDVGLNPGTFDYALVAEFDDAAGYLAYRDHPDHQAFIAGHIAGKTADRAAVQFAEEG